MKVPAIVPDLPLPVSWHLDRIAESHALLKKETGIDYSQILRDMPKRDNSAYHKAMKEARDAITAAEAVLGGPVKMSSEISRNERGDYIMTMTFTPDI